MLPSCSERILTLSQRFLDSYMDIDILIQSILYLASLAFTLGGRLAEETSTVAGP